VPVGKKKIQFFLQFSPSGECQLRITKPQFGVTKCLSQDLESRFGTSGSLFRISELQFPANFWLFVTGKHDPATPEAFPKT
jgi:hypothetical protein